ncbi:hypothetical protein F4801DRAFT_26052 [Xylaria longipes]|nr:hypothetical protein F4801DRAFT_26052 [Xylaria longipes]
MADTTPHGELISVLRELYTLLSSLSAVPTEMVCLPDPKTDTHPDGALDTEAAGYAAETIALMNALPYLAVDRQEMSLELLPSTFPMTCLGADLDEGYFLSHRELLNDVEMRPTAIRLTRNEIYGRVFIYDTYSKWNRAASTWMDSLPDERLTGERLWNPCSEPRKRLLDDYLRVGELSAAYCDRFNLRFHHQPIQPWILL